MDMTEMEDGPIRKTHRTMTVLLSVAAFALITSYLAVYAASNALIAADVIRAWPTDADPRPTWFLNGFLGLFALFALTGAMFRWVSNRHLRRIDAAAEAE